MIKTKLIFGSIIAVVLLTLVSFTSVFGYSSIDINLDDPIPDLDCDGDLAWTDVEPGSTVSGSFTVENIGDHNSLLDWEILEQPDWGTWSFEPYSGDDLTPEDGSVTVNVEVVAPIEYNEEFTGEVKVVNSEYSTDEEIIPVSLKTPRSKITVNTLFLRLLERFPLLNQLLQLV